MDIGSLTGEIVLEDQMSHVLTKVNTLIDRVGDSAEQRARRFEGSMTKAATVGSFFGNVLADMTTKAVSWGKEIVTNSLMAGARLEQLGVATRFMGEKAGYSSAFIEKLAKDIQATGI